MSKVVLAIDPGPVQSGWVIYDAARDSRTALAAGVDLNEQVLGTLHEPATTELVSHMVIERVQSYGRIVGASVYDTVFWSGRFYEAAETRGLVVLRMYFREVRQHLCGKHPAKERDVWAKVLDRFGGKAVALGTKAHPGPLYAVRSHARSALAIAVTWGDRIGHLPAEVADAGRLRSHSAIL